MVKVFDENREQSRKEREEGGLGRETSGISSEGESEEVEDWELVYRGLETFESCKGRSEPRLEKLRRKCGC